MSALGYTITWYWCAEHLPDGLDGLDPMRPDEAMGAHCEECGVALHGEAWAPERPTETADFPPTDEFAGEHAIEEDPDDRP